ncbi:MAG: pantoate--beta-alanine ligase [Gemmatimonadetes bacterium]|nr:pantoate--beta-alanine ligase [Gemmatimonadota bacterium]
MIPVVTPDAVAQAVSAARAAGHRIALVPTMGALHEGHLSLIDEARRVSGFVVMSVFVNPLQFGPTEDFASYPRDLENDVGLAAARGADLVFAPGGSIMYPDGEPATYVDAPALAGRLCGAFRPGHFRGVLTVVAKLFHIVAPDVAVFGRKDAQQLVMIRRMVRDLDFPIEIVGAPIVREPDGLALSSRNVYLSPAERADAVLLSRALLAAQTAFRDGERAGDALIARARSVLAAGPAIRPQYVEVVDAASLEPIETAEAGNMVAIAAHVGTTRLIDNLTLE